MRFLFRLDLNLHADAGKKFGILIFGTKHGASSPLLWLQRISESWSGQPAATPRICVNDDRSPQKLACVFSTSLQIFFAPGCIVLFHWFSFGSFLSKHYLQQESLYMWLPIPVLGCRLPASRACPELSFSLAAVWGERIEIDRVAQDSLERKPTMHCSS